MNISVREINSELCQLLGLTDIGTISAVHVYLTPNAPPRVEVTRRIANTVEGKTKAQWLTNSFDLVPHKGDNDAKH